MEKKTRSKKSQDGEDLHSDDGLQMSKNITRSQDGDDEASDGFNADAEYEINCGEDLFMELCEAWLDQHGSEILEKVINKPRKKQNIVKDGFYPNCMKK